MYDKRILLTGGAGFIGSHLACYLVKKYKNYQIIVLDILSHCSNLKNLSSMFKSPNFKFIKGDICSYDLINSIFKQYDINIIMHLAAETHVDHSFNHSYQFCQTNIIGTTNLLECSKNHWNLKNKSSNVSDKLFFHVSTDEVYGESLNNKQFNEESAFEPTNPYASSKCAAELMVMSYNKSFNMPYIITRSNNVYGSIQFPEKMIPKFIYLINDKKPVCLYGNGKQQRTYVHTSDIVNAFDMLLHCGKINEIFNIGPNEKDREAQYELDNITVVNMLLEIFSKIKTDDDYIKNKQKYIGFVTDRAFHDTRYYLNNDKIYKIGWKPKINFKNGLIDTVKWYLNNTNYWKNLETVLVPHPKIKPKTNIYADDNECKVNSDDDDNKGTINDINITNNSGDAITIINDLITLLSSN